MNSTTKNDSRVINFKLEKNYFAFDFYNHPDLPPEIAISTNQKKGGNYISILKYNKYKKLVKLSSTEIRNPPIKIQFSPFRNQFSENLLSVLTNKLSIYKYQNNSLKFYTNIYDKKNKDFHLICSDWNNDSKIISGSIKKIFLFDVRKEKHLNTISLHNDLVCDINFDKKGNTFVSCSNDKKSFLTDIRVINQHCMIFENKEPLHKCKWKNNENENLIAFSSLSQKEILIFDIRKPENPVNELKYHKEFVNNINWFKNNQFLISSDKKTCFVWDFNRFGNKNFFPSSYRNFDSKITNINVSRYGDFIGVIQKQNFSLIKILY